MAPPPAPRPLVTTLLAALQHEKPLLHVLIGPRQVGKTTAAGHVCQQLDWPFVEATADAPLPHPPEWIETHWKLARRRLSTTNPRALLVLDEIQKVRGWSEIVKRLWDEDVKARTGLRVLLLGSSSLLVQRGLTESLAGRFFLHRAPHWSFAECRASFHWDLDRWLYFGGYPGAASFIDDESMWRRYVNDSLVETVLARDVFQLQAIAKPALMRQLFALAAQYPAQILSFNKMLGQLQDAGNTVTLAHYLSLLETAFLASGLPLYTKGIARRRGSSPKLVLWNNALVNAAGSLGFEAARADGSYWGRLVENAVGAHLSNHLQGAPWHIAYWREGDAEVDYVVSRGSRTWALEVKSGRGGRTSGLAAFARRYPRAATWIVGSTGIPLDEFFAESPERWFT
ncbi:MAG: ATP-binding protein [Planctomycetes bacterium]|nr:ATP-binding protein [Planctomycetota bacterium]